MRMNQRLSKKKDYEIRSRYNHASAPLHARLDELRKEKREKGILPYELRVERAEVMEKLYQLGRGMYEKFLKLGEESK